MPQMTHPDLPGNPVIDVPTQALVDRRAAKGWELVDADSPTSEPPPASEPEDTDNPDSEEE